VLERIHEIMKANHITDNHKVGLYGITYKENVDDTRESPTLQMLELQKRHLANPLKSFDPFFTEKEIVPNQILDFDQFLSEVDMVVIMVKHDHIKQNWDKLKDKVILDCHNICPLEGVYHI
jgi:UDP-N-acetyl-D-mannosaminuronic acid dehydrogenase